MPEKQYRLRTLKDFKMEILRALENRRQRKRAEAAADNLNVRLVDLVNAATVVDPNEEFLMSYFKSGKTLVADVWLNKKNEQYLQSLIEDMLSSMWHQYRKLRSADEIQSYFMARSENMPKSKHGEEKVIASYVITIASETTPGIRVIVSTKPERQAELCLYKIRITVDDYADFKLAKQLESELAPEIEQIEEVLDCVEKSDYEKTREKFLYLIERYINLSGGSFQTEQSFDLIKDCIIEATLVRFPAAEIVENKEDRIGFKITVRGYVVWFNFSSLIQTESTVVAFNYGLDAINFKYVAFLNRQPLFQKIQELYEALQFKNAASISVLPIRGNYLPWLQEVNPEMHRLYALMSEEDLKTEIAALCARYYSEVQQHPTARNRPEL